MPAAVAVRVPIEGTVLALIFSVLVEVAFARVVIATEPARLVVPDVLLVMVVIVPDPLKLSVPELVNVANEDVPLILSVPVPALVNPPVPASAVETVRELLLVSTAGEVTVKLGILNVPVSAWVDVAVKDWTPDPALNAGTLVIPPLYSTAEFPELFQMPPVLIVTSPVNSFAPVAEEMIRLPVAPSPTVVVPVTDRA